MTTLILVRHGVTDENLNYTLIGRTDPPLNAYGAAQARAAAKALSSTRFDAIVSSPLLRCMSTAEPIAAMHPASKIEALGSLTEIDLGIVDGLSSFVAYDKYRKLIDLALDATLPDFKFPNGESRSQALRRFNNAIYQLVHAHPTGTVCVVTHGGPLGLWLARQRGESLGRFRRWQPAHASITRVVWLEGVARIVSYNETGHLPEQLQRAIQEVRERQP